MIYWCTVDPERPEVLDVGIRNGLWGVVEEAWDAIAPLEPGDFVLLFHRDQGFVLCEVQSEPYTEKVSVWSEVDYPHRVRISDPRETDRYAHLGEVHDCLLDRGTGEPYTSASEAAARLEDEMGTFRALAGGEIRCLFSRLGWTLPPEVAPAPEEEEEEREQVEGGEEPAEAEGEEPADTPAAAPPEDVPEPAEAEPVTAGGESGPAEAEAVASPEADEDEEPAETVEAGAGAPEPARDAVTEAAVSAPRVVLAPAAGNAASRSRYEETMSGGVELDGLEDFLPPDEVSALRAASDSDRVRVWGTAPAQDEGSRAQWEDTGPGDVILFTGGGEVFASARVLLTRRDPELARNLWGRRDDGETWEYLFFVTEPREQSVTYEEFNDVAGYEPGYRVPRLNVLETERSLQVLGEFPELGLTVPEERGGHREVRLGPADEAPRAAGEPGPPADGGEVSVEEPWSGGVGAMDERRLRVLLFGRRELGRCALCGRLLPVDLLEVVYVKPLEACTPEELEDVGNNVLPACGLGCAGLFRQGFVVVEDGVVEPGRGEPVTDPVEARVEELAGNRCEFWHSGSEPYYRWHAEENREP